MYLETVKPAINRDTGMVDPVRRPARVGEDGSLRGSEISDTDPDISGR